MGINIIMITILDRGINMPLTKKGNKILASMEKEYGTKTGKQVFYASANKGTIKGVHKGKKKKAKAKK